MYVFQYYNIIYIVDVCISIYVRTICKKVH